MADDRVGALVIGYGSELRRDDAAGRRVADAIEQRALPGMRVVSSTQLVPELVEVIAAADRVVFVDASVDVREVTAQQVTPQAASGDTHHATPAELLGLVRSLGLPCPPAFVVEVPASDLALGEGLSADTSAAIDQAVAEVVRLVSGTNRTSPLIRERPGDRFS